jgi:hypothetical protein
LLKRRFGSRRGKCGGPEKRRRKRELFSAALTVKKK